MRPLANPLTNSSEFDRQLGDAFVDGHVVGFLLDSPLGHLKRSGLISEQECVMPLHELLGGRATLFYPDPRRFEGQDYRAAIRDFGERLAESVKVPFKIRQPGLLLMTYREGVFQRTTALSLNIKTSCLWHRQVHHFIEEYLSNTALPTPKSQWIKRLVQTHGENVGVDALKACAGLLISRVLPL
jgi:hypothetical protein